MNALCQGDHRGRTDVDHFSPCPKTVVSETVSREGAACDLQR